MGGLAPGLGPVSGSPGPLRGHTSRLRSFWEGCRNEPVAVPAQWQEDSKSAFLMASTRGRLLVLGVDPFAEVRCTGFADGDCLWDLSLRQRTGDGKIDGETFLGRLLIFFFGGAGEGKRNSRARNTETMRRCFAGRCEFRTALCVCSILYVGQRRFHCSMLQAISKSALDLDALGSARALFRLRQPVDQFTHRYM